MSPQDCRHEVANALREVLHDIDRMHTHRSSEAGWAIRYAIRERLSALGEPTLLDADAAGGEK